MNEKTGKGAPAAPVILGIDPGSVWCGYGVVRKAGGTCEYVSSGRIAMPRAERLEVRLRELYLGLTEVVGEFKPQAGVVERIFFAKGVQAALSLGHARGVALLALSGSDVPVFEYSALQVKKAVTGYGRAEKHQVQTMVTKILGLQFEPSADSADALALALCHLQAAEMRGRLAGAGG